VRLRDPPVRRGGRRRRSGSERCRDDECCNHD
jgi:hypothetical protein